MLSASYPFYYDDAFISFRITENLREGNGPFLFPGKHAYTSTSLLYPYLNLIPAFLIGEGWIENIPVWNGCWMALSFCLCLLQACRNFPPGKWYFPLLAILPVLPWLFEEMNFIFGNSGLETSIYMASLAAMLPVKQNRKFSAWLILIRPEGWLAGWAVWVDSIWNKDKSAIISSSLQLFLSLACWIMAGLLLFGSPIPLSILAKANHLIDRPNELMKGFSYALFADHILPMAIFVLAAYRVPRFLVFNRPLILWTLFYLLFFSLAASWWPWYTPPLFIGFWYLGISAALNLLNTLKFNPKLLLIPGLLFLVYGGWQIARQIPGIKKKSDACAIRRKASKQLTVYLKTQKPAGSRMLLEPLGMISWYGPELNILDYPGLSSPDMAVFLKTLPWKIPHRLTDSKTDSAILAQFKPAILVLWPEEKEAFSRLSFFKENYRFTVKLPYYPELPEMDSVTVYNKIIH